LRGNNFVKANSDVKEHYKMYKVGRRWVFAGITLMTFGSMVLFGSQDVNASTSEMNNESSSSVANNSSVSNNESNTAVISSSSSSVQKTSSSDEKNEDSAGSSTTESGSSSNQSGSVVQNKAADENTTDSSDAGTTSEKKTTSDSENVKSDTNSDTKADTNADTLDNIDKKAVDNTDIKADSSNVDVAFDGQSAKATVFKASSRMLTLSDAVLADETTLAQSITVALNGVTTEVATINLADADELNGSKPAPSEVQTLTFSGTFNPGDSFTVSLPDEFNITGFDDGGAQDGNVITFTYDGTTTAVVSYKVEFDIVDLTASALKQNQAQIPDGTVVDVTVSKNGVTDNSMAVTLTNPTQYSIIKEIKRVVPTEADSPNIVAGEEYGYRIRLGAADYDGNGWQVGNGYRTQLTNAVVTIPVPAGFILNTADSGLLSSSSNGENGTTGLAKNSDLIFSQPDGTGGDILVTLPDGDYLDDFNLYLAGSYADGTIGTVTATGNATLTGTLMGQTITTSASTAMSDTLATENYSTSYILGSQNKSNTLLIGSDTSGVNKGGMGYISVKDNSNYETGVDYTVTLPDGMSITGIQAPSSNFKTGTEFTITATDINGQTYTDTVGMGDTYSFGNTARIATINVMSTALDPGDGVDGTFAQNNNYTYALWLLGSLADTYDDGSSLTSGDTLTYTVTDNTSDATNSNTQTLTNVPVSALSADSITYTVPSTVLSSGDKITGTYKIDMGKATFNGAENDPTPFEPIVYVVAPDNTVFDSDNPFVFDTTDTDYNDVKVTKLADLDGREVYELDWTGTGDSPLIHFTANYVVKNNLVAGDTVSIDPTLANGNVFITSPENLVSVVYRDTTYFTNVADQVTDTDWTIDNGALYTYYKSSLWQTAIPQTFDPVASIKSDADSDYLNYDSSDVAGTSATFKNTDLNNGKDGSVELFINNGSSITYANAYQVFNVGPYLQMTGAGDATDNGTLLYSTSAIDTASISNISDFDSLGLVPADQITDWSTVKAVVLETTNLEGSSAVKADLPIEVTSATDDGDYHQEAVQTFATNASGALVTSTSQISLKTLQKISYTVDVVNQDGEYISNTIYPNDPTTVDDGFVGDEVSAPTISGYTLTSDNNSVELTEAGQNIVFTYTGDPASATVTYVDDDDEGATVGEVGTLSGKTDDVETVTADVPTGYQLADGQAATVTTTLLAGENTDDNVVIHLVHKHSTTLPDGFTGTTTLTTTYIGAGGRTPVSASSDVTWTTDTDLATGATVYTPNNQYAVVNTPVISGFTADYSDNSDATAVSETTTQPTDVSFEIKYTPTDNIDHNTGNGNPTVDEIVVTRTIHYTGAGTLNPTDVVEKVWYKAVTNTTTGKTAWTPQGVYYEVTTPTLTGYTVDIAKVAMESPEAIITDQGVVPENTTITVTYIADPVTGGGGSTTEPGDGVNSEPGESGDNSNPGGDSTIPGDNDTGESGKDSSAANTSGVDDKLSNHSKLDEEQTTHQAVTRMEHGVNQAKTDGSSAQSSQKLPQTDESQNKEMTILGLSLMAILSLFGLAGKKKRQH